MPSTPLHVKKTRNLWSRCDQPPHRRRAAYYRCLRCEVLETRQLLSIGGFSELADAQVAQAESSPQKIGQTFVVDDWDNKVTENDLGFNYFSGNSGALGEPEGVASLALSSESHGSTGGSLDVSFDFTGKPTESFGGYFTSLFGLTDTFVSLDGSDTQPAATTKFPNYYFYCLWSTTLMELPFG